jgi:hypothetical protein
LEEVNGAEVVLNDREMMSMLLDLRTLPCNTIDKQVRQEAVRLIKIAYVEFGVNCVLHDRLEAANHKASLTTETNDDLAKFAKATALKLKPAHATALVTAPTAFDPNGTWSDDDAIDERGNANVDDEELNMDLLKQQLDAEFYSKFRAWRAHPAKVDWSKVDSNFAIQDPSTPDMLELMALNVGPLYKGLDKEQFGHLPAMASCSKGQIGALNAESFCERCLSCANLIVTEGSTLLLDDEVKMLVILRMNVSFMEFMRDDYAHVIGQQPWKMTIVD